MWKKHKYIREMEIDLKTYTTERVKKWKSVGEDIFLYLCDQRQIEEKKDWLHEKNNSKVYTEF